MAVCSAHRSSSGHYASAVEEAETGGPVAARGLRSAAASLPPSVARPCVGPLRPVAAPPCVALLRPAAVVRPCVALLRPAAVVRPCAEPLRPVAVVRPCVALLRPVAAVRSCVAPLQRVAAAPALDAHSPARWPWPAAARRASRLRWRPDCSVPALARAKAQTALALPSGEHGRWTVARRGPATGRVPVEPCVVAVARC